MAACLNGAEDAWLDADEVDVSTLWVAGFGWGPIIRKPTSDAPVCGGNCLIACSDEIERDRTTVLAEDRQSPVIAAKTRTHHEFHTHVFHAATFHLLIALHRYDLPAIEALEGRKLRKAAELRVRFET